MSLKNFQLYNSNTKFFSLLSSTSNRSYLWHVAMPKSGTTWLSNIFSHLYKLKGSTVAALVPHYGTRPQEIEPKLFLTTGKPCNLNEKIFFVQQHCVWSEYTEFLVKLTNTKIIFQHRNIFDVMISARDHYQSAIKGNNEESNIVPKPLFSKSPEALLDYIIDTKCGWYCEFLYGWLQSKLFNSKSLFQVRYEDLVNDTFEVINKVNSYFSLKFTFQEIERAINLSNMTKTRKNIGQNNRSKAILSDMQKEKILNIASYYNLPKNYVYLE